MRHVTHHESDATWTAAGVELMTHMCHRRKGHEFVQECKRCVGSVISVECPHENAENNSWELVTKGHAISYTVH